MERKRNRRICSASPPQSATYWVLRILTETGQGAPTSHHSRPHEGCWEKIRPLPERRRQVQAGGCRRTSALGPPEISPEIPLSCTKFLAGLALWGPGWKSTESASPSLTGALSAWRSPAASPVISSLGPPTDVNSKERLTLTWLFQSPRYAFTSISDSRNFFLLIKVLLLLLPAVSGIYP